MPNSLYEIDKPDCEGSQNMSHNLTFQRVKMVHFWFILISCLAPASPAFTPPPTIISFIINALVTQLQTFRIISTHFRHSKVSAHKSGRPRPLQIFLYGSGYHNVGQLASEPHAEYCQYQRKSESWHGIVKGRRRDSMHITPPVGTAPRSRL